MDPEDLIEFDDGGDVGDDYPEPEDDGYTDAEADADTLASAGMGTDEDYGYFGGEDDYLDGSYED
jgi:hypothetical protein